MLPINKKIVTDEAMQPVAVLIDYQDWQKIKQILNIYQLQQQANFDLNKYAGEIELLSYPSLTSVEETQIIDFLNKITVVGIDSNIKNLTIALRKKYKLKLPDTIIVATAKSLNATLFTNDVKLANLTEIDTQSVQII